MYAITIFPHWPWHIQLYITALQKERHLSAYSVSILYISEYLSLHILVTELENEPPFDLCYFFLWCGRELVLLQELQIMFFHHARLPENLTLPVTYWVPYETPHCLFLLYERVQHLVTQTHFFQLERCKGFHQPRWTNRMMDAVH